MSRKGDGRSRLRFTPDNLEHLRIIEREHGLGFNQYINNLIEQARSSAAPIPHKDRNSEATDGR